MRLFDYSPISERTYWEADRSVDASVPESLFAKKLASFILPTGIVSVVGCLPPMEEYFFGPIRGDKSFLYVRKSDDLNSCTTSGFIKKIWCRGYDVARSATIRYRIASLSPYTTNCLGILSDVDMVDEPITSKPFQNTEMQKECAIVHFKHKLWLLDIGYIDLDISPVNCAYVKDDIKIFDKGNVFHYSLLRESRRGGGNNILKELINNYVVLSQRIEFYAKEELARLEEALQNNSISRLRLLYRDMLSICEGS